MFHSIDEFLRAWDTESGKSHEAMLAMTDASLATSISPDDRTLGRVAWHIVQTLGEMPRQVGLVVDAPKSEAPVPSTARDIADAYARAARSLSEAIHMGWTDATLSVEDDMYGERWTRAQTLSALLCHEIHHRGQLTVFLRRAGLKPPSIYGPTREEWGGMGMPPPVV